jgi:hypothetical protein
MNNAQVKEAGEIVYRYGEVVGRLALWAALEPEPSASMLRAAANHYNLARILLERAMKIDYSTGDPVSFPEAADVCRWCKEAGDE